ncbi:hypothetical protein HU200_005606 [Digitaria exilis]|uniref:Phytocyanin domain-containing protein n=1 Tax=Digitaria exilis TaxID=1010633 RepID=A0A835FTV9_9POAL|nr:hypothetical protein HU200_005606 [Digitaria exilis]
MASLVTVPIHQQLQASIDMSSSLFPCRRKNSADACSPASYFFLLPTNANESHFTNSQLLRRTVGLGMGIKEARGLQSALHLDRSLRICCLDRSPSLFIPILSISATAMASGRVASLTLAALLIVSCVSTATATKYTVGDSSGWTTTGDYATWASGKNGAHTVDEVSAADYASCSSSNALSSDSTGSTTVTLKTAGKHYFICGVAGHCSSGMKLAVDVAAAKAPTPAPAPAPAKVPSPAPAPAVAPSPDAADATPDTTPAKSPSSSGKTPVSDLSPPGKKSTSGATGLSAAAWAGLGLAGLVAVHLGAF